jgi:hypothetical protein
LAFGVWRLGFGVWRLGRPFNQNQKQNDDAISI